MTEIKNKATPAPFPWAVVHEDNGGISIVAADGRAVIGQIAPDQPGLRWCGQRPEIEANAEFIATAGAEIERLSDELAEARRIIANQDASLLAAVQRIGLTPFGCGTPDVLADEIARLRRDLAIARSQ